MEKNPLADHPIYEMIQPLGQGMDRDEYRVCIFVIQLSLRDGSVVLFVDLPHFLPCSLLQAHLERFFKLEINKQVGSNTASIILLPIH